MGRKRGGLSDEDRALWRQVARSITPRADRAEPPKPPAATAPRAESLPERPDLLASTAAPPPSPRLEPFRLGEKTPAAKSGHDLAPDIAERLAHAPVRMDRKAFGRMVKGKLDPEARIDLHGMTQEQAHGALAGFIRNAYARQLRLVLVITGKGRERDEPGPMPVPRGVLRTQVPHWLAAGPLRLLVLQVSPAHLRHGGSGAYYVYLRRHRV